MSDDSTPGDGFCSLRKAITNADFIQQQLDFSGGDCPVFPFLPDFQTNFTINFSVSGTITLSSALPTINFQPDHIGSSLTVDGTGQAIQLDGADQYPVLAVNPTPLAWGPITFNELTIQNGNSAGSRGGIDNNGAALTVNSSTLSNNSSADNGGGISNDSGSTLSVTNSTFSGNTAMASGGGIYNGNSSANSVTVTNSTFSGNSAATNSGGAIYNNSNVANSVTVTNSILAGSGAGGNCAGNGVTNGGYNIADDASCGFGSSTAANSQTIGDSVTDANLALDPVARVVATSA